MSALDDEFEKHARAEARNAKIGAVVMWVWIGGWILYGFLGILGKPKSEQVVALLWVILVQVCAFGFYILRTVERIEVLLLRKR